MDNTLSHAPIGCREIFPQLLPYPREAKEFSIRSPIQNEMTTNTHPENDISNGKLVIPLHPFLLSPPRLQTHPTLQAKLPLQEQNHTPKPPRSTSTDQSRNAKASHSETFDPRYRRHRCARARQFEPHHRSAHFFFFFFLFFFFLVVKNIYRRKRNPRRKKLSAMIKNRSCGEVTKGFRV